MPRYALLLLIATLVPVFAAVGCDAAETNERVELELWTWALRPKFDDYVTDLIADFEAKNPGVTVAWVDVAAPAMRRKMFAVGAAGELPDVINFSDADFATFAQLGALRPLEPLIPEGAEDRYVPGALAACVVDGELLALPWYLSTPVRLANESLLAEGGLTPETLGDTWEELLRQAKPFHETTGRYLFTLGLGEQSDLPVILESEGVPPVVQQEDGTWQSNLTDPRVADIVRKWVDLYRSGALPREAATSQYPQMVKNYGEGRVAMINANAATAIRTESPLVYNDTVVLPGVVGAADLHGVAVTTIGVSSQSEHPELAAKLALHITSPPWQERLAREASRLPATLESLDNVESFLPVGEASDETIRTATRISAEQLAAGAAPRSPPIGPWPDLRTIFDEAMKRMLLGDDEPDVAATLSRVSKEWDRILQADAAGVPYK